MVNQEKDNKITKEESLEEGKESKEPEKVVVESVTKSEVKPKEEAKEKTGKSEDSANEKKEDAKTISVNIPKKKKKKFRRQILRGRAYIKSTYNNTVVTLTDMHGNVLAWSTAGNLGFKGAKKATSYAASQVVSDVEVKVQKYGLKELDVFVKGVGTGREAAIRALAQKGFSLNMIKDVTPIPHNGCRPKKPRRV